MTAEEVREVVASVRDVCRSDIRDMARKMYEAMLRELDGMGVELSHFDEEGNRTNSAEWILLSRLLSDVSYDILMGFSLLESVRASKEREHD